MGKFISYLGQARQDTALTEDRCRKAVSSPMDVMTGGGVNNVMLDSQGRQQAANSREQQTHYRGQPYISIKPIAQRIAGQPIRLARITQKPRAKQNRLTETRQCALPAWVKEYANSLSRKGNEDFTIVDQHPILDALSRPSPALPVVNSWSLKYSTVVNLETTGKAYWWMPVVKGRREVWMLPAHWVRPISDNGVFEKWGVTPDGSIEEKTVPREEIAPFWYMDPASPFRALGPLEAGAREIMVNEFVVECQKKSFQQGINPTAIVKMGSVKLDDGRVVRTRAKAWQKDQLRNMVMSEAAGVHNFGRPWIIDRAIESVEPYGNEPKKMDFGTNADSAQARVEQVFGTNAWTAGASALGSRAEAAVADDHFVYVTVNPKIELLSQVLTCIVLPLFDTSGRYVLFIEPAQPRDSEMEQKRWEFAMENSLGTINQYLTHVLRQPPVPWGDAVIVKQGVSIVPVSELANGYALTRTNGPQNTLVDDTDPNDQNAKPKPKPAANDKPPEEEDEETAEGEEADGDKSRARLGRKDKEQLFSHDEAFYDKYAETWLKLHESHETNLQPAIVEFLKEQGADVTKRLEETYGGIKASDLRTKATALGLVDGVFTPQHWNEKFLKAIRPAFIYALVAGATHELAAFGQGDALPAPDDAPTGGKEAQFDINFEFGIDLPSDVLQAINRSIDDALSQDYWSQIQETTKDRLADALQSALDDGDDMAGIVKRVKEDVFEGEAGTARAKNIARTECLPGDTVISGARAVTIFRRWYEGKMVEVVTASGRKLTGTPNHPVLTQRGWVALGELSESDSLINDGRNFENASASGDNNVEGTPTTIGEIFDSLAAVIVPSRKRTGKPDFHGDGMDGYVDILSSDSVLLLGDFAPANEFLPNLSLAPADFTTRFGDSLRGDTQGRDIISIDSSFLSASYFSASISDKPDYRTGIDVEFTSELDTGFPVSVSLDDFLSRKVATLCSVEPSCEQCCPSFFWAASRDTCLSENVGDGIFLATESLGDAGDTQAGTVHLDRVASLRFTENWSGHVYNLSTVDGYYSANGLYTKNCTHAMNAGQHQARVYLQEEGIVSGKEWFATYDGKTRESHSTADGQIRDIDEMFDVGGYPAKYPGDPQLPAAQRCNCRCMASSVTVFHKRLRAPHVKAIHCRGCEIHG